jgi:Putative, 10TM heavy-metal exporter
MTHLLAESLMITGFVAAMMLLIEYLNVATSGKWSQWLARGPGWQYLLASLLGATPGCLGAFTVVTLYAHGSVSFGAVVAAMIATSGDEAFVMFALIPKTALALTALLFVFGMLAGVVVDLLAGKRFPALPQCDALVLHVEEPPPLFPVRQVLAQWKDCSAARGTLTTALALFAAATAAGQIGPPEWSWIRVSLLAVSGASLFVVATVPEHFLEEHLWRHVARKHVPRVFVWTLAALAASGPIEGALRVGGGAPQSNWLLLLMACAIGLIPESGPHLIFVTLYAQHAIPFGVLLASSIVQDGHGMLPMLAHSRRAFLAVKGINFLLGLAAGIAAVSLRL